MYSNGKSDGKKRRIYFVDELRDAEMLERVRGFLS
jgi:hypothetical protein